MYKHLQSIAAFVAVAETGAFNKAAKKLGVNSSVVSHHVTRLEDHLGSTLIYRTTRKLTLSQQGRVLYKAAKGWMDGTQQAIDWIMDDQEEAAGALRIALPAFIPDPRIDRALHLFAELHPNVALTLNYSDQVANLLDEKIDLSIRIGTPPDSCFMRRRLSDIDLILVASPRLLVHYGTPHHPDDLSEMPFVLMGGPADDITLRSNSEIVNVSTQNCQIETNSVYGAQAAAKSSLGVASLPAPLCESALSQGTLVRLLPSWQLPSLTLQAIWPEKPWRKSLTTRIVKHLVDYTQQ